ncbi:hypothetical protein HKX48_007844, partial [Thoreauomyces humboldtii]
MILYLVDVPTRPGLFEPTASNIHLGAPLVRATIQDYQRLNTVDPMADLGNLAKVLLISCRGFGNPQLDKLKPMEKPEHPSLHLHWLLYQTFLWIDPDFGMAESRMFEFPLCRFGSMGLLFLTTLWETPSYRLAISPVYFVDILELTLSAILLVKNLPNDMSFLSLLHLRKASAGKVTYQWQAPYHMISSIIGNHKRLEEWFSKYNIEKAIGKQLYYRMVKVFLTMALNDKARKRVLVDHLEKIATSSYMRGTNFSVDLEKVKPAQPDQDLRAENVVPQMIKTMGRMGEELLFVSKCDLPAPEFPYVPWFFKPHTSKLPHVVINTPADPSTFRLPGGPVKEATKDSGTSTSKASVVAGKVDPGTSSSAEKKGDEPDVVGCDEDPEQPTVATCAPQAETILDKERYRTRLGVLASRHVLEDYDAPQEFRELYMEVALPIRHEVAEKIVEARRMQEKLEASTAKVSKSKISTQMVANLDRAADAVDALEAALRRIDLSASVHRYETSAWDREELRRVVEQGKRSLKTREGLEQMLAAAA